MQQVSKNCFFFFISHWNADNALLTFFYTYYKLLRTRTALSAGNNRHYRNLIKVVFKTESYQKSVVCIRLFPPEPLSFVHSLSVCVYEFGSVCAYVCVA